MRAVFRSMSVLLILFSLSIHAGDEKAAQQQTAEQAAMAAMMKAGTPGGEHGSLAQMAGTFDVTVRMWSAPGTEPNISTGVSHNRMILGGRWLEQRFESTFMGQKFEGVGYTGYDNLKKQYVGIWMDTMTTGMMVSYGQPGTKANTYEFHGTMDDPVTGKSSSTTDTLVVSDADHHASEMFVPAPDGTMFKMMELEYVRKK